ncbi:MAG TPA: histidine kinase dimerization/phospho-acceptor domain-containing protein, partial [Aeromicrobium sp.]|nr:histidine kinase dimerization/phospho-acceptor domain-containing protein [Aeromicrobium sp.]
MDLNHFPDGVLIAGPDERVLYANDLLRAMTGIDDPVGMHLDNALPFDDLKGHSWFDSTDPYRGLAIRTRIAEQPWFSPHGVEYLVSARMARNDEGGVVRVVVTVRNARVRKAHDREQSDLVATVAHELRSPLTGIKGFSSTLLTKWDRFSDDQRQLMLETIDADADRLTRLITELLDAARIDAGRLALRREGVDITDLLSRLLTSIGSGDGLGDVLDAKPDVPLIWADRDRLLQVFTNLFENAIRHGLGLRRVTVAPEEGGVAVEVIDEGPGIAVEDRTRVFSRFWRSGPGAG